MESLSGYSTGVDDCTIGVFSGSNVCNICVSYAECQDDTRKFETWGGCNNNVGDSPSEKFVCGKMQRNAIIVLEE